MRLLVLGGSGFLGHHVVDAAVAAGHEVTAFNRDGSVDVEGVEVLEGDRLGDLSLLRGRTWDAAFDSFGDPEGVRAAAELLRDAVGTYAFVSGISVYHPDGPATVDEESPLRREGDPAGEDPLQERSLAKLAGEAALHEVLGPERVLVVRPGIMVGPRDPSDRFTAWPERMLRALRDPSAREVLVPGDPTRSVQHTDARDLATWVVAMLDRGAAGTYNAVGPGREEPLEAVLRACLRAAAEHDGLDPDAVDVRFVVRDEALLREELSDVEEERRPLWFPEGQIPFARVDASRAAAAGLAFRPVLETARDTLAWALADDHPLDIAVGPGWEAALLAR